MQKSDDGYEMVFDEGSAAPKEGKLSKKKQSKRFMEENKEQERRNLEPRMESLAGVKGREKVPGIEAAMIGEGAVRGREREGEGGTRERGREGKMVIDGGERRRGGGLIHVLDRRGAETGIIAAATDNLEAGTDLERDIADTSVQHTLISFTMIRTVLVD